MITIYSTFSIAILSYNNLYVLFIFIIIIL